CSVGLRRDAGDPVDGAPEVETDEVHSRGGECRRRRGRFAADAFGDGVADGGSVVDAQPGVAGAGGAQLAVRRVCGGAVPGCGGGSEKTVARENVAPQRSETPGRTRY